MMGDAWRKSRIEDVEIELPQPHVEARALDAETDAHLVEVAATLEEKALQVLLPGVLK